jgi:PAS domain S-box-containing protein
MKLSIRTKLLIGFAVLLALYSLIQAFTFSLTREYISSQIGNIQLVQAQRGAADVENFFQDLNNTALNLARLYKENQNNSTESAELKIAGVSQNIIQNDLFIKKISFLNPAGKELLKFDSRGEIAKDNLSYEISSNALTNAANGKSSISQVYYVDNEPGPHIDTFTPIFSEDKSVIAIVKIQVDLDQLRQTLSNIKLGKAGFTYLVDEQGRLIAHPSQNLVIQRPDMSSRKIVALTLLDKPTTPQDETYLNENNVTVVSKAVKVPGVNWVVVFEQPTAEAFQFLSFIRNVFIVTLISSLVVLLFLALLISGNLTNSIRKLQQSTQLLEKGQLDTTINIRTGDEIESLANSFNAMARQLLQRETSLNQEKQETETILESLSDAVIALDENKKVILINKTAQSLMGVDAQTSLNKNVNDVLHFFEEEQLIPFEDYSQQSEANRKRIQEKGLTMTNQSGAKTAVSIIVSPVKFKNEEKVGWVITFYDITKEQELEEMRLDFVSMAAHELRTPLTAIRGYASLLNMQNAKDLNPEGKELVNRLIMSSENLANLIDNLLNVSRIERNTFAVEAKPTDLRDTIKSVVDSLKQQAFIQNQRLELIIPEKLPIVMADAFRIGQVLLNLIGNALNYTAEGGLITISAEQKGNYLQISVADNGQGIPKEALPKLFTKFFRVSGALEQGSKGTGLGLFISKSIIEMHGGKIWVESELNRGSTFTFVLPVAASSDLTPQNIQGIIMKNTEQPKL